MASNNILKTGLLLGSLSFLAACAEETQQAASQPPAPSVSVATVINERITEWDEFTGRLESPESVALRPRISGYIEKVAFIEGAIVKAGDPLFYIDDRPFKAETKRLKADLIDAKSQLTLAESNYQRAITLTKQKAISDEVYDSRYAEREQAKARVQSVHAALELAKLNLGYTRVNAPISGRVSRAEITAGNYVSEGQSLLTNIVSVDKIYAYFDADEQTYLKYIKLAKEGSRPSARDVRTPVYMALANESEYVHEGYIDFVDNRLDPTTGTIRGRAVFNNDQGEFIPGLFARVKVVGSATYSGILIDDKAVSTDLNNKYVLVLDKKNSVQYRPIALGEKLNGLRIIKSGLEPNDQIVVKGLQRVWPGSQVTPTVIDMALPEVVKQLHATQQKIDQDNNVRVAHQSDDSNSQNVVGG